MIGNIGTSKTRCRQFFFLRNRVLYFSNVILPFLIRPFCLAQYTEENVFNVNYASNETCVICGEGHFFITHVIIQCCQQRWHFKIHYANITIFVASFQVKQ